MTLRVFLTLMGTITFVCSGVFLGLHRLGLGWCFQRHAQRRVWIIRRERLMALAVLAYGFRTAWLNGRNLERPVIYQDNVDAVTAVTSAAIGALAAAAGLVLYLLYRRWSQETK